MSQIDLTKLADSIKKTGFVLEHAVTELLGQHGWTVINNKYYIDDVHETAREIDIVAYRARLAQGIQFYTVLIVSCKKSEKNAWAFLVRDRDLNDPNIEWHPVSVWCNNKVLQFMVEEGRWREEYVSSQINDLYPQIFEPSGHIFAFQEMDKKKCAVKNDKHIFNSISSLMKAEAYELSSLGKRKQDEAFYQFNLISVVDTELVKLHFKGHDVLPSETNDARFVINYMVNKIETSSRIHFVNYHYLDECLNYYDRLHAQNVKYFSDLYQSFYDDVLGYSKRYNLFKKDFEEEVLWVMNLEFEREYGMEDHFEDLDFHMPAQSNKLTIWTGKTEGEADFLNGNERVRKYATEALKKIYKYTGDFVFEFYDIPF